MAFILSGCIAVSVVASEPSLPPAVAKSFRSVWKDAPLVSFKNKKDRVEVKALDAEKKEFKAVFAADGMLQEFSEHKLAFEHLPDTVRKGVMEWDANTKWNPTLKAWKNSGDPAVYELTGELQGGRIITRFGPDGVNLKKTKKKDGGSKKSDPSLIRCC